MADGSLTYRALLRLFFALSRCVPLSWRYVLGMLATESVYWCWPSKRRNTQHNMAVVAGADAGSARANRLALLSWRNYGRYVVDFLNLPNVPPVEIVRRTTVDGWAHLDAVLAAGKGAIFVTGHFGLWDYAPAVLANRYPGRVYIVVEHLNSALLNELVQGQRALQGSTIIPMTNVRAMVRALRANGIIAVLVDRPVHDDGVLVTFFGRQTMVPGGAATLAAMTGAGLLPGYFVHRENGAYDGCILPPIVPARTGCRAAEVQSLTQGAVTALEGMIRCRPQYWYMFRAMWPLPSSALEKVEAAV